jgi:SagB-type dehydrogenase family enzyme
LNKERWSQLNLEKHPMSAREELQSLAGLLSEGECRNLLNAVRDVAAGERFWEGDAGIFYNEFVKLRSFPPMTGSSSPAPPVTELSEGIFAPIPIIKCYAGKERFPLPEPVVVSADFSDILLQRRSRREYNGESISLGQLSCLLKYACGVTGSAAGYGYARLPFRTFPSSGGLQSCESYLFVNAVEGVPAGVYHHQPVDHALELLVSGSHARKLRAIAFDQPFLETASVVFALAGYYERLRWKYHERAYRYMCVDAGFVAENIYLTAEALGLGACAISGFADGSIEEILRIDGKNEMALLLLAVGVIGSASIASGPVPASNA